MRTLGALLAFFALLAQPSAGRVETLVLPHALRSGETAWLEVTVGVIPRGAEIEVATTSGRLLGVISPFAIRSGNPAGTYTLPLPAEVISDSRVSVRVSLNYYHSQRAPTQEEVKEIRVKIADADGKHR
jgi:hypothetical protein